MAKTQPSKGIVLDASLILRSVKYYAVIGAGLGLLGVILLLQLGGGESVGGAIISGILSIIILSFSVLSGPIIAAFVGYAAAGNGIGGIKQRSVNSGIANGIGFVVFGVIVAVILWIGLALVIGGGGDGAATSESSGGAGPIELGKLVTLIILMAIPNSLVGGAITFFSKHKVKSHHDSHSSDAGSTPSTGKAYVAETDDAIPDKDNDESKDEAETMFSRRAIVALLGVGGAIGGSSWYLVFQQLTNQDKTSQNETSQNETNQDETPRNAEIREESDPSLDF